MSIQKPCGKVLKIKNLDNGCTGVFLDDNDLVIDVKYKLSKNIKKNFTNIIFLFGNKLLFDDKLISEYNIEFNQFVLYVKGADCTRYSNDDSDIIKCITIIDNYNDDEYFVNMNKSSTVRMLKSIIAKKYGLNEEEFYLEFNNNNLSIDDCKSLEQCGLIDGCIIHLITEKKRFNFRKKWYKKFWIPDIPNFRLSGSSNNWIRVDDEFRCYKRIPLVATLIPLTTGCEMDISIDDDLNDLIIKICTECRTQLSLIKLYSDSEKINQIRTDQDLRDFY